MKVVVLCPHFSPDTAPTGTVMTRIVAELAALGHEIHVVTALPWYRKHQVEADWRGGWVQTEKTGWGSITRVYPFPGADKANLARRAAGFAGFSLLSGVMGVRAGGWFRRADVVLAMSPPLPLGLIGWLVGVTRRAPLVFNIQDVFPDAAVRTGAITNRRIIAAARWFERVSYHRARAVTVLSDDLRTNVVDKVRPSHRAAVRVIPNFVDTDVIRPGDRMTAYRGELGIGDEPVVLYAGNVGFSQSLELMVAAARALPTVAFVINGEGAARAQLERDAEGIDNLYFVDYQPVERLGEVLASGDVHVVALKAGLGEVSVPSKTYSSLAAGRPVVASIDPDTAIPRLLHESGGGLSVAADRPEVFIAALKRVIDNPGRAAEMGRAGRGWVVEHASPSAIGEAYDRLLAEVSAPRQARQPIRRRLR